MADPLAKTGNAAIRAAGDHRSAFAQWDANAVWPGGAYVVVGAWLPPPTGAASGWGDAAARFGLTPMPVAEWVGDSMGCPVLSGFVGGSWACPIF